MIVETQGRARMKDILYVKREEKEKLDTFLR